MIKQFAQVYPVRNWQSCNLNPCILAEAFALLTAMLNRPWEQNKNPWKIWDDTAVCAKANHKLVISTTLINTLEVQMNTINSLTLISFVNIPSWLWEYRPIYLVLIGIFLCPFFFVFLSFRAIPMTHGGSQARGPFGAVATCLCQSHSNGGSEPHLQPTPQLTATSDP